MTLSLHRSPRRARLPQRARGVWAALAAVDDDPIMWCCDGALADCDGEAPTPAI